LAVAAFLATQEVGQGIFEVITGAAGETYGVTVDNQGRAFKAPSPDMLVTSGHLPENVMDNSSEFAKDPKTGKLMRIEDIDEETDDGSQFVF
jgi:hypothetical protein